MNFSHPHILWWLWALVPLVLGQYWVNILVGKRWDLFWQLGFPGLDRAPLMADQLKRRFALLMIAFILLVFALAGPNWGKQLSALPTSGVNIMIAIDLSNSMRAEDLKPSRLERAKRKVIDLIHYLQTDRVGLIAFAGQAFVQCPLTTDYGIIQEFLGIMDPKSVPLQGTSFSAVLDVVARTAQSYRDEQKAQSFALIIMSDGEDHDPDLSQKIAELKNINVPVYTLGFGTESGAPIPNPEGGFKKDRKGNMVVSKLKTSLLEKVASETGGFYQNASLDDQDIVKIYRDGIKKTQSGETHSQAKIYSGIDRSFWFYFAGVLVLVGQFFVGLSPKLLMWWSMVIFVFNLQSSPASAGEREDATQLFREGKFAQSKELFEKLEKQSKSPEDSFGRAISAYRLGDFKSASEGFAKAAQSHEKDLAARSLFNLGNAEAQNENFDGAIAAYEDALKMDPANKKIRDNLEYVKNLKEQKQNQPGKDKDDQKQQDPKDQKSSGDQTQPQQQSQTPSQPTPQENAAPKDQQNPAPQQNAQHQQQATPKPQPDPEKQQADRLLKSAPDAMSELKKAQKQKRAQQQAPQIQGDEDW